MEDASTVALRFADVPVRLHASRHDLASLDLDADALRLSTHIFGIFYGHDGVEWPTTAGRGSRGWMMRCQGRQAGLFVASMSHGRWPPRTWAQMRLSPVCSSHAVVANCGDSHVVLRRGKETIESSIDRTSDIKDEQARIEALGLGARSSNGMAIESPVYLLDLGRMTLYVSTRSTSEKELVRKQVFVLGRMGNAKEALSTIINKLEVMQMQEVVEIVTEQHDDELWEELIRQCHKKPEMLRKINFGSDQCYSDCYDPIYQCGHGCSKSTILIHRLFPSSNNFFYLFMDHFGFSWLSTFSQSPVNTSRMTLHIRQSQNFNAAMPLPSPNIQDAHEDCFNEYMSAIAEEVSEKWRRSRGCVHTESKVQLSKFN
ncbi:Vacuolar protein sorting-associated protein 41 [Zea mays]|uniref:protein-serine/threonine phosphatase n=1 Tax=Zea mays TaxID=4577 RepID=A0A3L6FR69_MAIZE|nr:Vacuolar protein sorting-associated protein 41 [Zea mays]